MFKRFGFTVSVIMLICIIARALGVSVKRGQ